MSGSEKRKIPAAPTPASAPGNLLSSVAPPLELPNFITATNAPEPAPEPVVPTPVPVTPIIVQQRTSPPVENFSPAIPLSKGEPMLSIRSPEDSQTTQSPDSLPDSTPDVDKIGDVMPGSALFTWVKGAVSTGGILHRVAEKAKSSVDSMITTLDPQMKEYLKSGGDIYIVVASDKEVKTSTIREAFQAVFGKATIVGIPAQSDVTAVQPVGYAAAYAAAKQRIADLRSQHGELNNNVPIVAIEGFLQEVVSDRWYDLALLVLSQPSLGIELQMQSQGTGVPGPAIAAVRAQTPPDYPHSPTGWHDLALLVLSQPSLGIELQMQSQGTGVPGPAIAAVRAQTPPDYPHSATGYSNTVGSVMAASLQPSLGIELQMQSQGTGVPGPAVAAVRAQTPPDYPHSATGYSNTVGGVMAASLPPPGATHTMAGGFNRSVEKGDSAASGALARRVL